VVADEQQPHPVRALGGEREPGVDRLAHELHQRQVRRAVVSREQLGADRGRFVLDRGLDGRTFVDGTLSGSSEDATAKPWQLKADVKVTGEHTGTLEVNLSVDNAHKPLPAKSGTFVAIYDGKRAPALPKLGPCYSKLPKATPLAVAARRSGSRVKLTVTADIEGDNQPLAGAEVKAGGRTTKTDSHGRATVAAGKIVVAAGDTFRSKTLRR
jgi:hypothetical protein